MDPSNWADFEILFQSKGGPSYCWCMVWRMTSAELKQNTSANRKTFIEQRVQSGTPIGLFAYADKEPIAWCSIAPRDTHLRLGGDDSLENVWSITCFYIKKAFRGNGLTHTLIEEAKKYATENGAGYLEAYPVAPDSPCYRFMGFVETFEKTGFRFVKKAGTRRNVMIHKLQK
ncbi:MAG: GNAT family N-acetyltransferase [Parapedobacter sp.]|nr:MAG: GNAT family N-acetyltransferase [Parapedobacter sp.]